MRTLRKQGKTFVLLLALAAGTAGAGEEKSQPPPQPPASAGPQSRGERAFGSITSVGIDRFEMKRMDGSALTVMVNDQTHFQQGQQEIQLEDLKAGDRIAVRGSTDAKKAFVATTVRRMTDEDMQRFQNQGERVFGEIISIDPPQIKVRNPRTGERIVVVNDQTVMMKEGQPITLKDLKVGDRVFVLGKESDGQFVASRLMTGQFRGRGGREDNPQH